MVTIPTTALKTKTNGIKLVSLGPAKLIDVPPAQDSVQEHNTKDNLNGAGDSDHEEIPPVDDVVQVRGNEVIDLSDKISALLSDRLLLLPLDTRLVRIRWGGFGGQSCGSAFGNLGSVR
jgi:hypothetical protein